MLTDRLYNFLVFRLTESEDEKVRVGMLTAEEDTTVTGCPTLTPTRRPAPACPATPAPVVAEIVSPAPVVSGGWTGAGGQPTR